MNINIVQPSSVLPGQSIEEDISIADLESKLLKLIGKKQINLLNVYNKFSSTTTANIIKDIFKNLEEYFKSKNIDEDEKKAILTNVFSAIKSQISILENLNLSKNNEEVLVVLFATVFLSIKRFLS